MSEARNDHIENARAQAQLSGVIWVAIAALLWSLNGALIKLVNQDGQGPNGVSIAFWRSLIAGLFLLPFGIRRMPTLFRRSGSSGPSIEPRLSDRRAIVACVFCFAAMTTSFVVATTKTAAANAIILQYTSTFWVFGLSPWITGERANRGDIPILALAMMGIAIIFWGSSSTDLAGLLIALSAGMFYGLLTLLLRRVRGVDSMALTVANNLGTALVLIPFMITSGTIMLPPRTWLLLIFMGIVQFGLPYYFFSLGLNRIPAHQAALICMAEPILVPVWAYVVVANVPEAPTVIGGSVILLALVLFVVMKSMRRAASSSSS